MLIESHGDFTDSATLRSILEEADSHHVALLWDAHNTFVDGKEDPMFTLTEIGKYVRHVHLKDSYQKGSDIHYVLTGRGNVPVKRQVQLLMEKGYHGSYSLEWEKFWHPDIEDPEIALTDYVHVMEQYFREARDKSRLNISN